MPRPAEMAPELAAEHGIDASENRVHRLCSAHGIFSVLARKRGRGAAAGPPVHDDLVRREFTAKAPNRLWSWTWTANRWPTPTAPEAVTLPRRLRNPKSKAVLSLLDLNTLGSADEQEMIRVYGSLAAARARYDLLRNQLEMNPGHRPEAFWIFEGPADMQTPPFERLSADYLVEIALEEDLGRRRLAYLAEHDLLDEWEIHALMRQRRSANERRQE